MSTDTDVMSYLDLVIQLATLFDHGVVERTAVNRGIGADLDIVFNHDAAQLRNFMPSLLVKHEPEAIGTDNSPAMQDATITQPDRPRQRDPAMQVTMTADDGADSDYAPMMLCAPISAASSTTALAPTLTPSASLALAAICAE